MRKADIDAKDCDGRTAVHRAVELGLNDEVSALVHFEADVNLSDNDGKKALHLAQTEKVARILLESGADINSMNRINRTPLHMAVINEREDVVSVLLEFGADVNLRDNVFNQMAIHYAQSGKVARSLLENGADVDAEDSRRRTPLLKAVIYKCDDVSSVLLKSGANVNLSDRKGQTALHYAQSGKVAKSLLESGADVDAKDYLDRTPLHQAVIYKRDDVLSVLLESGANVNLRDLKGQTALHSAQSGKVARSLLESGANVDAGDLRKRTPLHLAVLNEHDDVVLVLLKCGADVNLLDRDKLTALHYAQSGKVAKSLLESGAEVDLFDCMDRRPLHQAVIYKRDDVSSVLLKSGADVKLGDRGGQTPLHYAQSGKVAKSLLESGADVDAKDYLLRTPLHQAVKHKRDDVLSVLLESGADVNRRDRGGQTALHYAQSGKVARSLIESGADVDAEDEVYLVRTPLHQAVIYKRDDVVSVLLEFGADVNLRDRDGQTALHYAQSANIAGILIRSGADVNAGGNEGLTPFPKAETEPESDSSCTSLDAWHRYNRRPLDRAVYYGRDDVISVLLEFGADVNICDGGFMTALHYAQSGKVARMLIERGAHVNVMDYLDRAPLHLAVINDCEDVVLVLLEFGTDVKICDGYLMTALHYARSEEVARILLDSEADVNVRDYQDRTPLHLAVLNEHDDVVLVLLKCGADVNLRDRDKLTALHYAQSGKVAKSLLESGADVDAKDNLDRTPLHQAVIHKRDDVVSVLLIFKPDVNLRDKKGQTALHYAQSEKVARSLLKRGADVDARNNDDRTPLHSRIESYRIESYRNESYRIKSRYESGFLNSNPIPVLFEFGADIESLVADLSSSGLNPGYYRDIELLFAFIIISLKVANLIVCDANIELMTPCIPYEMVSDATSKLPEFKTMCVNELDQLKIQRMADTSLHYILYTDCPNYLLNNSLTDALNKVDFSKYPVYGKLLASKIENDKLRSELLVSAKECFYMLLKTDCDYSGINWLSLLPEEVERRIWTHLDNKDLRDLIRYRKIYED